MEKDNVNYLMSYYSKVIPGDKKSYLRNRLEKAPNGIIGFETALSAEIMNLVDPGYIDYINLVRLTSYTP